MAMSLMSTMYALDVIHYTLSRHDFDPGSSMGQSFGHLGGSNAEP